MFDGLLFHERGGEIVRDLRIDFFKGMLMWSVVYGHTINALLCGIRHEPIWLHTFVRTFDMPFFMILSGFFLRRSLERRLAIDVFINRLSMIFVPIVIWTVLLARIDIFNRYYFLWAVLCSGILCIVGHSLTALLPSRIKNLECFLYIAVIFLSHLFKVPWNMFYLFPFFVVGYYLRAVSVNNKLSWVMSVAFITGLCFWNISYTPWSTIGVAWRDDPFNIWIYGYRFFLGVAGVCTIGKLFDAILRICSEDSFFVRSVSMWGRETLALYVLQTLCVEIVVGRLCGIFWRYCTISVPAAIIHLVGYLIAPALSFVVLIVLFIAIKKIKSTRALKYVFGFKVY